MRFASDDDRPFDSQPDFDLDRDFPLGDGTADTSATVVCPYCGEPNEVSVDTGSGTAQEDVEDCQVCCQPWRVSVHYTGEGRAEITATPLDE
jgi:hypothetical protein